MSDTGAHTVESLGGGCQCGAIQFRASGSPQSVHYCHCSMCRRAVAGPFAVLAWFLRSQIEGNLTTSACWQSSPIAHRAFCSQCGSPLYLCYEGDPQRLGVYVGLFENLEELRPTHHYGIEGKVSWAECSPGLPAQPTRERF